MRERERENCNGGEKKGIFMLNTHVSAVYESSSFANGDFGEE